MFIKFLKGASRFKFRDNWAEGTGVLRMPFIGTESVLLTP